MAAKLRRPKTSSWGSEGNESLGLRPDDSAQQREKAQHLPRAHEGGLVCESCETPPLPGGPTRMTGSGPA